MPGSLHFSFLVCLAPPELHDPVAWLLPVFRMCMHLYCSSLPLYLMQYCVMPAKLAWVSGLNMYLSGVQHFLKLKSKILA